MSKITCSKCGKSFETYNKELDIESYNCPSCGHNNKAEPQPAKKAKTDQTGSSQEEKGAQQALTPSVPAGHDHDSNKKQSSWEAEWKTNLINAYINTVKDVITQPIDYFKTLRPFEDFFSLAIFIFINSFIATLASMAFQFTFGALFNPAALIGIPFLLCGAIVFPVIITLLKFLIGGLLHLFLKFIGGTEKEFNTTMSVYGLGSAAMLFEVIPFVGWLINLVYVIIVNIFGQAKAHEITPGRAFLSILLPTLIVFCLIGTFIFGIIMLLGGLGAFFEQIQ